MVRLLLLRTGVLLGARSTSVMTNVDFSCLSFVKVYLYEIVSVSLWRPWSVVNWFTWKTIKLSVNSPFSVLRSQYTVLLALHSWLELAKWQLIMYSKCNVIDGEWRFIVVVPSHCATFQFERMVLISTWMK